VTEAGSGALMPSEVAAVAAQPVLAAVDAGKTSAEDWQLWWLRGAIGVLPALDVPWEPPQSPVPAGRRASFMWHLFDDLHTHGVRRPSLDRCPSVGGMC
jgi:hypothetical protein